MRSMGKSSLFSGKGSDFSASLLAKSEESSRLTDSPLAPTA
jgi:hypothetical protein